MIIQEFILNQAWYVNIAIFYTLVWGFAEGFKGVWLRLISIFTGGRINQNFLGKLLQSVWYVCILLVIFFHK